MASTQTKDGEPKPAAKEYIDIIRSDILTDKTFIDGTGIPSKIQYYCRDCEKLVRPKRIGNKFQFSCTVCNGKNVAFGTEKAIQSYYKPPSPIITPSQTI